MARRKWLPWLFVAPALILLSVFLVYPTIQTVWYSLHKGSIINPTRLFVGLDNFVRLFTRDRLFLKISSWPPGGALINTALWLLLFPTLTVAYGLLVAVLADKVRYEALVKAIIFLPMVISATAASVIFRFVYSPDPNIGVINAFLSLIIPHFRPIAWLGRPDLVNLAIILAGVWIWTGLAMVVLSAAYKALPAEITEAARVDGASPFTIFFRIHVPMMVGPISFVFITMVINALKLVDLVLVMTNGGPRGASRIIGFTVYQEIFTNIRVGYGSAVAVVLFVLIIPFMSIQIRRVFREDLAR